MAIYSLNLGFISRSEGRSSVGFSAYMSAGHQQDERTGILYDYGCKENVIVSRVLAPQGAPEWAKTSSSLWNVVEQFEDEWATLRFRGGHSEPDRNQRSLEAREHFLSSTQTAQTIMGAIPLEFSQMEAEACVEAFLEERFVSRGLVVEYAIHWDRGNPHFHGMITRRSLVSGSFAERKDREIVSKVELLTTRKLWETVVNKHLELGGYEARIDSRSHEDRGSLFLPTEHEGWHAQRLAENGQYSRLVGENEAIRQKNMEILCKNPAAVIQEIAFKRTTFTRQHVEEEIMRRVGGDEKLFSLLKAKVEGYELPLEMVLKTANDNTVFAGAIALRSLSSKFANQLINDEQVTYEIGEDINRNRLFASVDYKKQEEAIIERVDMLHGRCTKEVSSDVIAQAIKNREGELKSSLSAEQQNAITHLCSGPDIRLLNGKAGTGKTTLLKAVAEAYQNAGYHVLGTSFQGKAVEIMEQEIGIPCKTLDSYRVAWENYDKQKATMDKGKLWSRAHGYASARLKELESHQFTEKNVIIVDEANMIGGRLWDIFLKQAATKGAKVLIVQDPAQIKSRDPGDYGRLFAERFGFCETSEVVRQRIPWQRECSKLLNDYQVLDGLQPYDDKGHLEWFEGSSQVHQALASAYVKDLVEYPEKTRIALAYQNSEVYQLNQSIRQELMEHGWLGASTEDKSSHSPLQVFKIEGEEYAIGDRIRFTENDNHGRYVINVSALDQNQVKGIKNGSFGIIESYDKAKSILTVCLESNKFTPNRIVQFNTKEYAHFTLGYAMGIHKSEGSTFDKSFVCLSPLVDPSTLLVAMTRHRDDVKAYLNRDQFLDFKDAVEKIGRPVFKETLQDHRLSEEQKPYFNRVQHYRDLTREAVTLREEMESSLGFTTPLYKHPSYGAYQTFFEEKKRIAETILKNWQNHVPYVRLAGIRKDVLEVEAVLRPRLLSDLEHRASIQVEAYMDLVKETRTLWNTVSQTHPGALAKSHPLYEDYQKRKIERDSIAAVIQENPKLYVPFFRVTKNEEGKLLTYWGEVIERENRVYISALKSHAEGHSHSQRQSLYYERLTPEQRGHYDEVKAYVAARNEAAAVYSHLQKKAQESIQMSSPENFISLTTFHTLQAQRDALALKLIDSPAQHQIFFGVLKVKENKLLEHAVSGEIREKVQAYGVETDVAKKSSQAQELKRILTRSQDYRIFKESGLDSNRLTFDVAFYDKVKSGDISPTLHPEDIYKPIQAYLNASKESFRLWKIVQMKSKEENAPLKERWKQALTARNENAQLLLYNQASLAVIAGMRQGITPHIVRQAGLSQREAPPIPTSFQKTGPSFLSVNQVHEAARGRMLEIATDLLGSPNQQMSSTHELRFGKNGSLRMHISGPKEGQWIDFESGEHGNLFQLVQREKNMTFKEALIHVAVALNLETVSQSNAPTAFHKQREEQARLKEKYRHDQAKETASRLNGALELQMKSKPIEGTPAETYLREVRGITDQLAPDLRYLPKGTTFMYGGERKALQYDCFAAFGRDEKGSLRAVQLTKLTGEGKRALTLEGAKLNKIQYGVSGGAFVVLQEGKNTDRVFMAEGLETALSIKEANVTGKIVASLGIHNISNYKGPEKEIILCADNDEHKPHSKTHTFIEKAQDHLTTQGHTVALIKPSHPGDDFNDVLKKQGIQGVQVYVKPYLAPRKEAVSQTLVYPRHNPDLIETKDFQKMKSKAPEVLLSQPTKPNNIEIIAKYLAEKIQKMKAFEGSSLADKARQELKATMESFDARTLEAIKAHDQNLAKDLQHFGHDQSLSRGRGVEM